jgi:hypothetical protein
MAQTQTSTDRPNLPRPKQPNQLINPPGEQTAGLEDQLNQAGAKLDPALKNKLLTTDRTINSIAARAQELIDAKDQNTPEALKDRTTKPLQIFIATAGLKRETQQGTCPKELSDKIKELDVDVLKALQESKKAEAKKPNTFAAAISEVSEDAKELQKLHKAWSTSAAKGEVKLPDAPQKK